jgi:hypothetical protein
MKFRVFALGALGLGVASIHGCSSSDATGDGTTGGKSPTAGRGGATTAGTSETGGSSDHGGQSATAIGGSSTAGAGDEAGSGALGAAQGGNGGGSTHHGSGGGSARAGRGGSSATGGTTGGTGTPAAGGADAGAPDNGGAGAGGETASAGSASEWEGWGGEWYGGDPGSGCTDDLNLPLVDAPPATLDQTGLYTSPSSAPDNIAPYVYEFTPRYPLWSDGALKRRFIYLPKCTQIDTSDMNHWRFPVGTRFWKEFTFVVDAKPVRVETRFIHHYGPGDNDWLFIAYQWDPNVTSPTAGNTAPVPDGVVNANGTEHDIPPKNQCASCHTNLPERILGFSAFELTSNPGNVTISLLGHEHLLTVPAPNGFSPPGTPVQQDGLGYLHTNCGGCHNAYNQVTPTSPAPQMRLLIEQTSVESTDAYTTLVNVPTYNTAFDGMARIAPGDPSQSEIITRMSQRGALQMPPIATEVVDSDGVAKVSAFIDSLTP